MYGASTGDNQVDRCVICGKPSGDLYFILEKFPTFGVICRLHTSSYRSIRNLSNGLMQIRRLNRGSLSGIKAMLKASPEKISYYDHDGIRHTSVAYILSLEIGGTDLRTLVANMTEPARLLSEGRPAIELSSGVRYVVHESDEDRAMEIASEFYPNGETVAAESVEPSAGQSERDEQLARICEAARRLGFNDAKTRMLIGQSAGNLAGLEQRLLNELDHEPGRKFAGRHDNGDRQQPKRETNRTPATSTSNSRDAGRTEVSAPPDGGFLF